MNRKSGDFPRSSCRPIQAVQSIIQNESISLIEEGSSFREEVCYIEGGRC